MPLPPLTDFLALLGIDLVLCATLLRCLTRGSGLAPKGRCMAVLAVFILLWVPVGAAHLPVLAYVRGWSSDLSTTLVALACLSLGHGLFGLPAVPGRERLALNTAIVAAAALLYPTALGWGDWDAYRAGWGSWGMLASLLILSLACWVGGFRLVPALVGIALLAWTAGWMESGNLWDYLIDPWLVVLALVRCVSAGVTRWRHRGPPNAMNQRFARR